MRRRHFIGSAAALPALGWASAAPTLQARLAAIEVASGGEIGVCALDSRSGRRLGHRLDQRFAMCSTFKAPLAAWVLARVEAGALALDQQVPISSADLVPYAPAVSARLAAGRISVAELCAASVGLSGGPPALTAWLRSLGDTVTRLDRLEPELNENIPGDPRDTSTASAMADTLHRLLLDDAALKPASRAQLLAWMESAQTGLSRLRAGLPAGWRAGDKTGTGPRGAVNDVAIVFPPSRAPWLVAVYLSGSTLPVATLNQTHEQVMRALVDEIAKA
jgi:beta-lactamase class A